MSITFRAFFPFCGSGGGALGFARGAARHDGLSATFRILGGFDVDPAACRDFETLTGVAATPLDLFSREDYAAYHGHEPPPDWREVTYHDIREAAGFENPDVIFLSAPCRGFSGLQSPKRARSAKYQALNRLLPRALRLCREAFADDPPSFILSENVPRMATSGRHLVDQVMRQLDADGYATVESTHDCGELGGLAQHRRRYLLVARHREKVRPFLYEPPRRRVRGIGEVLGALPLPDDPTAGPMHVSPQLQWQTWVRLALIRAGSDWRSLAELPVRDGVVVGLGIEPLGRSFSGTYGVKGWGEPSGTVTGEAHASTGPFSVADPRPPRTLGRYQPYGVVAWDEPSRTITSEAAPGAGPYSVADPRLACDAEDRRHRRFNNVYRVVAWDEPSRCVTAAAGNAMQSVADPRMGWSAGREEAATWSTCGHYGVIPWSEPSPAVVAHARHDNRAASVADPRLPAPHDRPPTPLIIALDGTWHRPLTTAELAVLQGFPFDCVLDGNAHGVAQPHRKRGARRRCRRHRLGDAPRAAAAQRRDRLLPLGGAHLGPPPRHRPVRGASMITRAYDCLREPTTSEWQGLCVTADAHRVALSWRRQHGRLELHGPSAHVLALEAVLADRGIIAAALAEA